MTAVPVPLDALPLGLLERRFAASVIALPSGAQVGVRTGGAASSEAPAVVLLHGIGSGAASWLQVALALADASDGAERRVIAWDAPGYGASTPLAADAPTAADYAERLGELLAALQVEACVLVGHSLGALMAAAFASGPGRRLVRRLVLISPARGYGAAAQAEARQKVLTERSNKLERLGIAGMAAEAPARMLSAHADPAARAWVQWNAARLDAAGYRQAVRMLCNADLGSFTALAMPVEVHCGDADAVTPPDACRAAAAALGAPFALVAQAGHASPVEQPDAVARLIAGTGPNDAGDKTTMNENTAPAEDGGDKYIVPALERGLKLLGEFSRENRRLGAPELARRLGLPRSTVFRLLNTLESLGFIERVDGGTEYRLGMAVLRLGFEYLASLELTELGQPLLERLCDDLGVPCNLVVRDGRAIVYVAKVTPPTPLVSVVRVGTRLPAHATVLGRVLLEDLSLAELRRLYPEERLETFSPRTPKTVIELFDLVAHDRDRGFVVGEGFFEASISTVAAPVRDQSTRIIAALGVTIPSDHVESDRIDDIVQRVRGAAEELSRRLNYRPRQGGGSTVVALGTRKAS